MQPPSQAPIRYHTPCDPATDTCGAGAGSPHESTAISTRPAFIALGSNLGHPAQTLHRAVRWLAALPETRLVRVSSFHRTAPVGPSQPDYLNAVVELATTLSPYVLLTAIRALEAAARRVRDARWGPRTLDLDILLVGQVVLTTPDLTVPHPRMLERLFVLEPLAELAPDLVHPVSGVAIGAHRDAMRAALALL